MKTFLLIATIILFVSCGHHTPASFQTIDLTYSNGWTKLISVYIDSTKNIKIRTEEHLKGFKYYETILSHSSFNRVSLLAKKVLATKHDSVINSPVPDGGGYSLIMTSKNNRINSTIYCAVKCYKPLDSLVFEVIKLADAVKNISTDSLFKYRSYDKFGPPPPPLKEIVKFVPPIIKDNEADSASH